VEWGADPGVMIGGVVVVGGVPQGRQNDVIGGATIGAITNVTRCSEMDTTVVKFGVKK